VIDDRVPKTPLEPPNRYRPTRGSYEMIETAVRALIAAETIDASPDATQGAIASKLTFASQVLSQTAVSAHTERGMEPRELAMLLFLLEWAALEGRFTVWRKGTDGIKHPNRVVAANFGSLRRIALHIDAADEYQHPDAVDVR
jgi:hypothetical protein